MTAQRFGRGQKAITLVPLALLSAAWTASLVGGSTATAAGEPGVLPDGTSIPTDAVQDPANYSDPADLGLTGGSTASIVRTASVSGIPSAALAAYQRAETVINAADRRCNLPWQLVAAIGRVESDHGRYGGNTLGEDGVSRPGIFGIALDGTNDTQKIADSDGGLYDSDATWDRAVGPMQFIPTTWSVVGVDADGDTRRNPQDIDDAALATAVYLCSGDESLDSDAGRRAAVHRYNHSDAYVDLVLRVMQAYLDGDYTSLPNNTTAAVTFFPQYSGTTRPVLEPKSSSTGPGGGGSTSGGGTTGEGGNGGGSNGGGGTTTPPGDVPTQGPGDTVGNTVDDVPVVPDVLDHAEALVVCREELGAISDPLNQLVGGDAICADKVQGKTEAEARSIIPNTLAAALAWLGLG
ncbi:lytic transglycosylase domain-containing protein [Nocardioides guangzhouensis]|uniref:lytic transglycosylase domain-containing protein n=1 Tax=Nocardioides guangzhouensis TaxID=2497878 RepID=UPI001C37AA30|nr:lytic transglycosylase domain-containing protein [Nocardioides guangzhouensis]